MALVGIEVWYTSGCVFPPAHISRALPSESNNIESIFNPSVKSVSDEKATTLERQLEPLPPFLFITKPSPLVSPKKAQLDSYGYATLFQGLNHKHQNPSQYY